MKKILLFTVFIVAFTMGVQAQDKKADLKKLLQVMNTEKMIDGMMDNMVSMMKKQMASQSAGADAQEKASAIIDFMMEETKGLSKKIVNEEMMVSYDKHFTAKEIKELIKFYESPVGQKMLDKTPQISADMMEAMQTKYLPAFQNRLKKKIEELKQ